MPNRNDSSGVPQNPTTCNPFAAPPATTQRHSFASTRIVLPYASDLLPLQTVDSTRHERRGEEQQRLARNDRQKLRVHLKRALEEVLDMIEDDIALMAQTPRHQTPRYVQQEDDGSSSNHSQDEVVNREGIEEGLPAQAKPSFGF